MVLIESVSLVYLTLDETCVGAGSTNVKRGIVLGGLGAMFVLAFSCETRARTNDGELGLETVHVKTIFLHQSQC